MSNAALKTAQMRKFGWYGLLKNLKFFEPYLLLYMIFAGLTFTEIGILYAIREAIVWIFEIPSGVFADRFGKKTELIASFVFYIASFIGFALADSFAWFVVPMVLFGFGEAFRSGTHKAMIMAYLDHEAIDLPKRQVYGYTRSYSNVGSVVSSLFGIALILSMPDMSLLFLIAIVPYVLDLVLIASYPSFLNKRIDRRFSLVEFVRETGRALAYAVKHVRLRLYLVESAGFQAIFKSMRDYIQPLLYGATLTVLLLADRSLDDNIKIIIGLTYAVAQLVSVFVTRHAYRLGDYMSSGTLLALTWTMTATMAIALGLWSTSIPIILISFVMFYAALNLRKPYMVQKIGDATIDEKRASVLSIESQLSSVLIIILAPVMGWISDTYSIGTMFLVLGSAMVITGLIRYTKKGA